ncbi:MAG: redoxin domain-containing protein [Anaerolineales bacterium]|nr:redoxin domain-containing protein [Anaerolineales bacterium]
MPRVSIQTPAPDFALPNFQGETVRLSDFRGKSHVLLVFNRTFQ